MSALPIAELQRDVEVERVKLRLAPETLGPAAKDRPVYEAFIRDALAMLVRNVERARDGWGKTLVLVQGSQLTDEEAARAARGFHAVLRALTDSLGMLFAELVPMAKANKIPVIGLEAGRAARAALPGMLQEIENMLEQVEARKAELAEAIQVRRQWLELQGATEEELAELCDPEKGPPLDLAEEQRNLEAGLRLKANRPSYEDLLKRATASDR